MNISITSINSLLTVISIFVTIISLLIAWWQNKRRLNIQKMLQQESFLLHWSVALVLGNCQEAIKNIRENQIPEALISSGKAEGGTQTLLQQTIKIICHYHNPTDADITNWFKRGKIDKNFKPLFKIYSDKNSGGLRSMFKKITEKFLKTAK